MQTITVDFGHSAVKAASEKQEILIPYIVGEKTDNISIEGIGFDGLEGLLVEYKGDEYLVGDLAKTQTTNSIQNVHDEDIFSIETKITILTAVGYLANDNEINLIANLPSSHYDLDQAQFKKEYLSDTINLKFYDFKKNKYNHKSLTIKNIDIKPQGFHALMHEVLDNSGELRNDKVNLAEGLNVLLDIGRYSTDPYISDELKRVAEVPVRPLSGMQTAYKIIQRKIAKEYRQRKKIYEIEDIAQERYITKSGNSLSVKDEVEAGYKQMFDQLISEVNNLLPFSLSEADNILVAGGGALALENLLQQEFPHIKVVNQPRFANCLGGRKWGRRIFNGKQDQDNQTKR